MKALITGGTGQDGYYLANYLDENGHDVHIMSRQSARIQVWDLPEKAEIYRGDVTDLGSVIRVVEMVQPEVVFNLAAQSYVGTSWHQPQVTYQVTGLGAVNVFEAVRILRRHSCRIYQASSSEMFGNTAPPQSEDSRFAPRSPYGCAKLYAHNMAVNYRESFGMHISCGIMFNHESPARGLEFVTSRLANAAALAKLERKKTPIGNLAAKRDWGHAIDYVKAMVLMVEQEEPGDYVIATGVTRSVEEFAATAFEHVGLDWREYLYPDTSLFRPAEVNELRGDATKAREKLGWEPKLDFGFLVRQMVEYALMELGGG